MRTKVILDTGVLVAVLDKSDRYHNWAIAQWSNIAKPVLTCEAVISQHPALKRRGFVPR